MGHHIYMMHLDADNYMCQFTSFEWSLDHKRHISLSLHYIIKSAWLDCLKGKQHLQVNSLNFWQCASSHRAHPINAEWQRYEAGKQVLCCSPCICHKTNNVKSQMWQTQDHSIPEYYCMAKKNISKEKRNIWLQ